MLSVLYIHHYISKVNHFYYRLLSKEYLGPIIYRELIPESEFDHDLSKWILEL